VGRQLWRKRLLKSLKRQAEPFRFNQKAQGKTLGFCLHPPAWKEFPDMEWKIWAAAAIMLAAAYIDFYKRRGVR
jgi:hypothetical protein